MHSKRALSILTFLVVLLSGCGNGSSPNTPKPTADGSGGTPTSDQNTVTIEAPGIPPTPIPKPHLSGNVPLSVTVPPIVKTPEQARVFFDVFSWQSFIALNWPVVPGQRGVPNQPDNPSVFKQPNGTTVVWGSYKEASELFGQGPNRPTPWNSQEVPVNPCGSPAFGEKQLMMASKGGPLLGSVNQAFSLPLIDQNLNYVYYEVRLNKTQYEFIRGPDSDNKKWLYLLKNLAAAEPVAMPASSAPSTQGALMVKASWRQMTDKDDPTRYYIVESKVYDPATQTCVPQKMGLVGLHIVQKLADFPEWIWSSFEQVDNVQKAPGSTPATPISFNNGTDVPPTAGGWANRPSANVPPLVPKNQRVAVQVTRFNPIPISTQNLNDYYQNNVVQGTVWANYQLVITQWPTNATQFKTMENGGVYPADCGGAFPANGCTNTSMETYYQSANDAVGAGGNSCMQCHYRAGQADFSWSLMNRAHP